MTQETKRWVITGAIAIALLVLAWWGIAHRAKPVVVAPILREVATTTARSETQVSAGTIAAEPVRPAGAQATAQGETITAGDQAAGRRVVVREAAFSRPTWIAITDTKGWILGAGWFLKGGSTLTVPLLRATKPGEVYQAVLYRDNGDKKFDFHVDTLIVSTEAAPVSSTFRAQ